MSGALTARGVAFLLTEEAVGLSAYLDPKGIWTWAGGVAETGGHAVRQYKDNPQPLEACLRATVDLIRAQYLPAVVKAFGARQLAEHELAAALSFIWRNGTMDAQWVRDVLAGKPATARQNWMQWTDHGRQLPRATRERDLFFGAVWPADLGVRVFTATGPSYQPVGGRLVDVMPTLTKIMGAK